MVGAALMANIALAAGVSLSTYQAYEANRQKERAQRHFASVRKLANVLMFDLHDAIQGLSGSLPARKLLVENALTYLEQLGAEAHGDAALQIEIATGLRKVADIQGRPFASSLGEPQSALASYRKALLLLEPLASSVRVGGPHRHAADMELLVVRTREAEVLTSLGEYGPADAAVQAGIAKATTMLAASPSDAELSLRLAELHGRCSELRLLVGDLAAFARESETEERLVHVILERSPQHAAALRGLASHYNSLGIQLMRTAHGTEEARKVAEVFRKGLRIVERLRADNPTDTNLEIGVVALHTNVGVALHRANDLENAERELRTALELYKVLAEKDIGNQRLQADAAGLHANLASVLLDRHDFLAGANLAETAIAMMERLPAGVRADNVVLQSEAEAHYALGRALVLRAGLEQASASASATREDACRHYEQARRMLESLKQRRGNGPADLQPETVIEALRHCG